MKVLLLGSAALRMHGVYQQRPQLDVDFMCSKETLGELLSTCTHLKMTHMRPNETGVSVHFKDDTIWDVMLTDAVVTDTALRKSNAEMLVRCCEGEQVELPALGGVMGYLATLNTLYLFKMSHRYKKNSKFFLKTMDDIRMLRRVGAVIDKPQLLAMREAATYDYGHPKLNVDKASFFKDDVPYKYDHDSIHEAVAVDATPAYTKYMVDGQQVLTSRAKFEALPERIKLLGVLEESYVLALERSVIPHKSHPRAAFAMALSKVCTSITSGWFREYAWENHDKVLRMYSSDYVDKFNDALLAGRIRPFKGSQY